VLFKYYRMSPPSEMVAPGSGESYAARPRFTAVELVGPRIRPTLEVFLTYDSKRFRVGDVECIAVSDGTFLYPIGWLFSNVPAEQVESSLLDRKLPTSHVESPYTCLLVKSGKRSVLIDTGADGLAPTTGNLLRNLEAEGVSPEEITT